MDNANNDLAQEYLSCIRDLLHLRDVQDLKAFTQHMNTLRFQYSLNVSYYTFPIARRFHLDSCSAARTGFFHDLYHYGWRNLDKEERPIEGGYCAVHPQIALENARKAAFVSTITEDAIVHHMWPVTLRYPRIKEGWVLQTVDKYCVISEVLLQGGKRVRYSRLAISLTTLLSSSIRQHSYMDNAVFGIHFRAQSLSLIERTCCLNFRQSPTLYKTRPFSVKRCGRVLILQDIQQLIPVASIL